MSTRRLLSLLCFVTLTPCACTASPSTAGKQRNFFPQMPPSHPSMACVPANPCCSTCTSSCPLMRTIWYVSFFVPFNLNGLKPFCFREICSEEFTWSTNPRAPLDRTSLTLSSTRLRFFTQLYCCFSASIGSSAFVRRWAEEIALLSARRHTSLGHAMSAVAGQRSARQHQALPLRLFTAYIDQVTFKDKGEVGDRIVLTSQCCRSFGGILEIEVKAEAYKAHEQPRSINVAYFCVSGIDACGKPLIFLDVIPETDDERSRYTMSQVPPLILNRFSALICFRSGPHACGCHQSRRSVI